MNKYIIIIITIIILQLPVFYLILKDYLIIPSVQSMVMTVTPDYNDIINSKYNIIYFIHSKCKLQNVEYYSYSIKYKYSI